MPTGRTFLAIAALATILLACGVADSPPVSNAGSGVPVIEGRDAPRVQQIEDVFQILDRVALEESDSVVNVWPNMQPDPRGGMLVADQREGQFRRYALNGVLRGAFGREGPGPGEFEAPAAVARLDNGRLLALGRSGRAAIFDAGRHDLVRTLTIGLTKIADVSVLDDTLALISGTPVTTTESRIHRVNLQTGDIETSFFDPLANFPYPVVANYADWAFMDRRDGEVVATASVIDTLYFFGAAGELRRKIVLPSSSFRPPRPITPEARESRQARVEWLGSFDLVAEVFWIAEDTLLVQYQTFQDAVPEHRLVGLTAGGDGLFEIINSPELHAATASGDTLIFHDPSAVAENRWLLARLR